MSTILNKTDSDAKQRELWEVRVRILRNGKHRTSGASGFTITTDVCTYFYAHKTYPKVLDSQIRSSVAIVEKQMGKIE